MREVSLAFAHAGPDARAELRRTFVDVAKPVAIGAEQLALGRIRRMPQSPRWAGMRVGVTRTVVYVAPKRRGVKTRGADPRRRPNVGTLLMVRAMEPALERNQPELEHACERALDRVADHFNR